MACLDIMMFIDMQDYLDEDGVPTDIALEAAIPLAFLTTIIETASEYIALPVLFADVDCRCSVQGKPCPGEIEVWVYADANRIGWECLECGDEGVISHWEGTPWDRRVLHTYH